MFEQDGVMIPFDIDTEVKHGLRQVGKKFVFSINGIDPEDAGLYQVEVDGVKIFSTDLKRKSMKQINYLHIACKQCQTVKSYDCHMSCPMAENTHDNKVITC